MEFPSRSLTEACIVAYIELLFSADYTLQDFSSSITREAARLITRAWGAVAGIEQGDKIFQSESCLQSPNVVTQ